VNAVDTNAVPGVPSVAILAREFLLRFAGATLQVLATLEIIRVLSPPIAGIYFEGFVLAYGLAAILRGKYEIYLAHYIVGRSAPDLGVCNWKLTCALARRTLLRHRRHVFRRGPALREPLPRQHPDLRLRRESRAHPRRPVRPG
jgi:hypothetical protein